MRMRVSHFHLSTNVPKMGKVGKMGNVSKVSKNNLKLFSIIETLQSQLRYS